MTAEVDKCANRKLHSVSVKDKFSNVVLRFDLTITKDIYVLLAVTDDVILDSIPTETDPIEASMSTDVTGDLPKYNEVQKPKIIEELKNIDSDWDRMYGSAYMDNIDNRDSLLISDGRDSIVRLTPKQKP